MNRAIMPNCIFMETIKVINEVKVFGADGNCLLDTGLKFCLKKLLKYLRVNL